jgi:ribosomal protein L37AE/L43A
MNAIFTAAINAVIQSKRKCPKCGNSQVVPRDRKRGIVICKTCGAEIPPPSK